MTHCQVITVVPGTSDIHGITVVPGTSVIHIISVVPGTTVIYGITVVPGTSVIGGMTVVPGTFVRRTTQGRDAGGMTRGRLGEGAENEAETPSSR